MSPLLLCLCNDPVLLETRTLVLATRYRVTSVSSPDQLKALPDGSAFNAILLCHTLSDVEAHCAISYCTARWPDATIVGLDGLDSRCRYWRHDAVVDCPSSPRAMLDGLGAAIRI